MNLSADIDAPLAPGKPCGFTVEVAAFRDTPIPSVIVRLGPAARVVCGPTVMTAGKHVFMASVRLPARLPPEVSLIATVGEVSVERKVPVALAERREPVPFAPVDPIVGPVWHRVSVEARLEPRGSSLVARRGGVVARIQLEPRPGGAVLCARLAYPSLGLGLVLGTRDAAWRHGEAVHYSPMVYGTAREARQARTFLDRLGWRLDGFIVSSLDDTAAVVEAAFIGPAYDLLRWFVGRVLALAAAIDEARPRLLPPTPMRGHLAPWGALATALDGTLYPPDLSIAGRYLGSEVTATMAYQQGGYGTAMRVSVTPGVVPDKHGAWHVDRDEAGVHFDVAPPFRDAAPVLELIRAAAQPSDGGPYR